MQLSDAERREFAKIERHLAAEDPALARTLSMPAGGLNSQQGVDADPQGDNSSVITLSLPIVGQRTPPPERVQKRRSLGRWLMAAGVATVATSMVTGAAAAAAGGFLLIAAGKFTADR
jgi:hypothetical protein